MRNRPAKLVLLVLIPLCVFANPKERGATKVEVVTARTNIHGSSSGQLFTYTDLMFIQVNGKRVVYECAQRGDICPVLESGKTYTVDQQGDNLYIPMNSPQGKKDSSAKYRRVGSW